MKKKNSDTIFKSGEDLWQILADRIGKTMRQIDDYKFLSEEQWNKKKDYFHYETFSRYIAFLEREIEFSEEANKTLTKEDLRKIYRKLDDNDIKRICIIWDEILCNLEPKFKNVVEYKPTGILDADDEITVPQFIENYFRENHIKIEFVDNKSQLERELFKKWNELYPEKPRTLSTFHRNLPRK